DRQTDAAQIQKLQEQIETTLGDVRVVVEDWKLMRERARELVAALEHDVPPLPADELGEARSLLTWMEDRHFVFLGYRYYRLERGSAEDHLLPDAKSGLGILRGRPGAKVTKL